jgi:hyperosmotically inducible periplasmic protein
MEKIGKGESFMKRLLILLTLVAFVAVGCQAMTGKTARETVDDVYIVSAINGKILADPDLKFLQINVGSYDGNVTLSGRVPSAAAQSKLIDMAQKTKGVKKVTANLVIGSTKP